MSTCSLTPALQEELLSITRSICGQAGCRGGKGILAADETPAAMDDRFSKIGLENTKENRRLYRQLLFTSPKAEVSSGLSAVILQDETAREVTMDDGRTFVKAVQDMGLVPGITLDRGWRDLPGCPGEVFTQGMDDISERCAMYKKMGFGFCKWRMWIKIDSSNGAPSSLSIEEGARSLALYAAVCQANGLVPIVEPDIDRTGNHCHARAQNVFEAVNVAIYKALKDFGVFLEATILKCSMVTPGKSHQNQATPEEVGRATQAALSRTVPSAVPGIFFLSGGLTELEATEYLNGVNKFNEKAPWSQSFCFGRALQDSARRAWNGKAVAVADGQKAFVHRVKMNSSASMGKYDPAMEKKNN